MAESSLAACSGASPNWTAASAELTDVADCANSLMCTDNSGPCSTLGARCAWGGTCDKGLLLCSDGSGKCSASGVSCGTGGTCVGHYNPDLKDGDTVNVPAGSATWNNTLTISKGIRLHGAGIEAGAATSITTSIPATISLKFASCAMSPELDNFLFKCQGAGGDANRAILYIGGSCDKIKIHNNKVSYVAGYGGNPFFYVYGNTYGVIYQNVLDNSAGAGTSNFITVDHSSWNGGLMGDGSFSDAPNYTGSEANKFLYVEGNTYSASNRRAFSDMYKGARMVERYNTITNGNLNSHGFDSSGRGRSYRLKIGYNNRVQLTDGSGFPTCLQWRGGTGLMYGNDFSGWNWRNDLPCMNAKTYRYSPTAVVDGGISINGLSGASGICAPYSNELFICDNGRVCNNPGSPCTSPGTGTCTSYPYQCSYGGAGCTTFGAPCGGTNGDSGKCGNFSGTHYMCNSDPTAGTRCCYPTAVCANGTQCNVIGSACSDGSTCTSYTNDNPYCVEASQCAGGASQCIGPLDDPKGDGQGTPCQDGIGMGQDSGFGTSQYIEPMFVFSNVGTNKGFNTSGDAVKNVNYFTDDSGGVASGADSAKPATCTSGYAYWATDTRKLYRCNSGGNGWDVYYTEYQCPNPLTGLSGSCDPAKTGTDGYVSGTDTSDTIPPSAPSGLSVQ